MGIISIAVRSGICIYAVKYTVDQGAWGNSENAIKFKEQTCKAINGNEYVQTGKSHFQAYVPMPQVCLLYKQRCLHSFTLLNTYKPLTYFGFQLPELPKSSEMGFVVTHYYNKSVKGTVHFVEMLPCYTGQLIKKVSDTVKKALDQPAQS